MSGSRPFRLLVFSAEGMARGYGSASALRLFVQAVLVESDWQLTVVQSGPPAPGAAGNARLRAVGPRYGGRGRRRELACYAAYVLGQKNAWVRSAPDTVLSWQPIPAGIAGTAAARASGVPHVVRTCGPELARAWSRYPIATAVAMPWTKRLLKDADAVVVKSGVEHELVEPWAGGRVHCIQNAVGKSFFVPRVRHGDEVVRLITVCQLEAHKRVDQLIGAVARIGSHRCQLTVVGDGSQRNSLQRMAAAAGVRADFTGRLPQRDLPACYAASDVFVLASVLEGCSNAALEAMAAGLPVIGARSALRDLVQDGRTGILADAADERSLAVAIERYFCARATWPAMESACREKAGQHTARRLFRSYARLFQQLCPMPPA